MNKLIDTIQVDVIHDWEVRYLCADCHQNVALTIDANAILGGMEVVNLGVSTAPRARICQNCNRPAGTSLATRRINEIAIGKPRALTHNETTLLKQAIERIDLACQRGFEKRFLHGIDRLVGVFVYRYEFKGLTAVRAYRLVPNDLRQMIDDLDTVYFNKNVSKSGRLG